MMRLIQHSLREVRRLGRRPRGREKVVVGSQWYSHKKLVYKRSGWVLGMEVCLGLLSSIYIQHMAPTARSAPPQTAYLIWLFLLGHAGWVMYGCFLWIRIHQLCIDSSCWNCATCKCDVLWAKPFTAAGERVACPECGADLFPFGAVLRGRPFVSPHVDELVWWIFSAVWFISTGVWVLRYVL